MANPIYEKALKSAQKEYRKAVSRGEYPYLPALDDMLERTNIQREENLGLVEIPLHQIVGTKTAGRQHAFAANFMPLMSTESEFYVKWTALYDYQEEEGVKDPIIAYEFMNKFYVMEGNKRVSVFKFLDAPSIEGYVTRIVPYPNDTLESKIYFEFLEFYKKTRINYVRFSDVGKFKTLIKAVGKQPDEQWSEDERKMFSSNYNGFQKMYFECGGKKLSISTGDAFLFYLSLYPYSEIPNKSLKEIRGEIEGIWKELMELDQAPESALVMKPEENEASVISRLLTHTAQGLSGKKLRVGFIYDRTADESGWSYAHELGRAHIDELFADRVETMGYCCQEMKKDIAAVIDLAIEEGCQVIFTTHQKFLGASLKAAIDHPERKILNCSVNRPYTSLRTYYGRMYEAKFLCGMVAGAMCENDRIAYKADYPIYGSYAAINAFAIGARMVNPRAKVYVHWSSLKDSDFDAFLQEHDISLISDNDMIRPKGLHKFGLYRKTEEGFQTLATPIWDWGKFYEKIVQDILYGTLKNNPDGKSRKAINYWWGISSGVIDLIMSQNLDIGLKRLVWMMRDRIHDEEFRPFTGPLYQQDGTIAVEDSAILSPEQIITMDWFIDSVIGEAPKAEELTEEAKIMVQMQESQIPILE